MDIQLTDVGGQLTLNTEPLFYQVASDDHGFIDWPEPNPYHLFAALFDMANIVDDCPKGRVLLPGGEVFGELVSCGFNPDPAWEARIKTLSDEHARVRKAAQEH